TRVRRAWGSHEEMTSSRIHAYICSSPLIVFPKTGAKNLPPATPCDRRRPLTVAIDKKFSIGRRHFRKPSLFLRYSGQIFEKFEMFPSDVSQHGHPWPAHRQERLQLSVMVRPHLEH